MANCKELFKIFSIFLVISILFLSFASLSSCGKMPSALEIMNDFCIAYDEDGGSLGRIYATGIKEGDDGYIDDSFFYTMFGEGEECVYDYAVMLLSNIDTVGECSVFVCYSEYDAMLVSDMCLSRKRLLSSLMGSVDISFLEDCFIKRYGRIVVMCVLSDNERAERIFDRII